MWQGKELDKFAVLEILGYQHRTDISFVESAYRAIEIDGRSCLGNAA